MWGFENKSDKKEKLLSPNGQEAWRELEGSLANAHTWSIDTNRFDKNLAAFKTALRTVIAEIGEAMPAQMRDRAELVPQKFIEKHGQDVALLQFAAPLFQYAYNSPAATNALAKAQYGG